MEKIENLEYRIKQKGSRYYPQYKYGFRTMWSFENIMGTYADFITYNKLEYESNWENWEMYFYEIETAQKYIDEVVKLKHFEKYYKKIHKQ
jgi:hypothetical protein